MAKNFKSRKFLVAVITAIGAAAASLIGLEGTVGVICAIISAVVPAVTYIITEGVIDAKGVELALIAAQKTAEIIKAEEEKEGAEMDEQI